MTFEDDEHLDWLVEQFHARFVPKYKNGAKKYKEHMLQKDNLLEEAIAENLDQYAYLMTLYRQRELKRLSAPGE